MKGNLNHVTPMLRTTNIVTLPVPLYRQRYLTQTTFFSRINPIGFSSMYPLPRSLLNQHFTWSENVLFSKRYRSMTFHKNVGKEQTKAMTQYPLSLHKQHLMFKHYSTNHNEKVQSFEKRPFDKKEEQRDSKGFSVNIPFSALLLLLPVGAVSAYYINKVYRGEEEEADTAWNLGLAHRETKNYEAAIKHWERALDLFEAQHREEKEADTAFGLGFVYEKTNNHEAAIKNWKRALDLFEAQHREEKEADTAWNLGIVYAKTNNNEAAIKNWERALNLFVAQHREEEEAETTFGLGFAYRETSNYEAAIKHYERALGLYAMQNRNDRAADAAWGIGMVYEETNNDEMARRNYERSSNLLNLFKAQNRKAEEADTALRRQ